MTGGRLKRRLKRHGGDREGGFSLPELLILLVIVSILAGLAVPLYLSHRIRASQAEATVNLAGIFAAERVFYGEAERYSHFADIGFTLAEGANRYTYRTRGTTAEGSDTGEAQIPTTIGPVTPDNSTVAAASSLTGFTATATANLDFDAAIDQWHVNDRGEGVLRPDTSDAGEPDR